MKQTVTEPPALEPAHLRKSADPSALVLMQAQMQAIHERLAALVQADRRRRWNVATEGDYIRAAADVQALRDLQREATDMLRTFKRNGPADRWLIRDVQRWAAVLRADLADAAMDEHGPEVAALFREGTR